MEKLKYSPITVPQLSQLLDQAKNHYLDYCQKYAAYMVETSGLPTNEAVKHPAYAEAVESLKLSTGIFDEAMRRVARDYSDEKYQLLLEYYQYVRVETAWGTRLWMNIFYNIMGFPKTFWLMRHFKFLL